MSTPVTAAATTQRFLNEREVADLLGISPKTLQNWRWRGLPPRFRKFNGCVRYRLEDLLEFTDEATD